MIRGVKWQNPQHQESGWSPLRIKSSFTPPLISFDARAQDRENLGKVRSATVGWLYIHAYNVIRTARSFGW